jgi:cytochrome c-type biogenesis protein CcmE
MKHYARFAILIVVILGILGWLAASGINESKTYYKTISELRTLPPADQGKRMRVTGNVVAGSIQRAGTAVRFTICEQPSAQTLQVIYTGKDPLPDTFRDSAQAMADGRMQPDGTFHANSIAAKCPSKYEAAPGARAPVQKSINSKPSSI